MRSIKDFSTKQVNKILAVILTITMVITSLGITNYSVIFASDGDYEYAAEYSLDSGMSSTQTEVNETDTEYGVNDDNEVNNDKEYGGSSDDKEEYDYEYGDLDEEYCDDCDLNIIPPELGGLGVVPISGGAQIVITAFTSTNQVFTTNESNPLPLSLQIAYRIDGEGNAGGGQIRIALEDDATHPNGTFFATTIDRINVTLSDVGQQHIDVEGIIVESVGSNNTLIIPFTGGERNVTLDTITVSIDYNRVWDGTIPPGSPLHTFEAWAVNDGAYDPTLTIDVTSNTTDTRVFRTSGSLNVQNIQLDSGIFSYGATAAMILEIPATSNRWEFAENTQVTFTAPIPQGAQLGTIASNVGVVHQQIGDEIIWEMDVSDINRFDLRFFPRMQFPSEHFSVGQVIVLNFTANYYLQDAITGNPYPVTRTLSVTVTLTEPSGGVPGGEVILNWSGNRLNMIANNNSAQNLGRISVNNQNNLPAENLVITIHNNYGISGVQTGNKVWYNQNWHIRNAGSQVATEWTFFIRNADGTAREPVVRTHNGSTIAPGNPLSNFHINNQAGLAPNEYIDRIEIRPQHNGNNALAPGSEFMVDVRFSGFAGGIDHTGGSVGANIDGFVDIPQRVTITYDGLAEAFEREEVARFFALTYLAHDVTFSSMTALHSGTAIEPGGALPVRFLARSDDSGGSVFLTRGIMWEQPSFLLFVPQGASIDTTQSVEAFRNMSNESLGIMSIEYLETESTGIRVYRLQTEPDVSLAQIGPTVNNDNVIRFDVNITTPFGTPAGNSSMRIWAIGYAGAGARHTLYQANGAVATGFTTAHGFFADVNNWTGHNHLAPYQRIRTANFNFTVASSAGMLARAQMWNHGGNAWQLGGTATVPVGGQGRFQLEVINSGNQFVGDVRLYNILPHSTTTNTASGAGSVTSQWNATLESLSFRVYDRFGDNITSLFTGSQIWVSEQYNSNPSGNYPINRNLINTDFMEMDETNILTARSFVFDLGTRRLDPGARIVIQGNVALPTTMTAADIGQTAQNSFVTSGQFFNALTGGTAQGLTPQISDIQTFEATAENNASISGTVYRALAPGVFDGVLEGVTVRLYSGGTAASNFTGTTAITNEDGEFSFTGLSAGNYYLRFVNPFAANPGMSATFNGTGLTAYGLNAVTGTITLNADAAGHAFNVADVGLVRTGLVQVQFRRANDNSLINNTTHTIYSLVNLNTDYEGTITPGAAGQIPIPDGYTISGAAYQDFDLTWDAPSVILEFNVIRDQFNVEYNNNGGTGTITSQTADTGTNITLSDGTGFTRDGHTLLGWAIEFDGVVVYALEATFTRATSATTTLYAAWQANAHTVTYQGGGHTGGSVPAVVNTYFSATVTLAEQGTLARTGHTFIGWRDGVGTVHAAGSDITISGNVTLTAEWQANAHTVMYQGGGNTGGSVPATVNTYFGATVTLAEHGTLTRTGHSFIGWRDSDGTVYAVGSDITISGNVTLTAEWQANAHTVTYQGGGNTGGSVPAVVNTYFSATVTLAEQGTLTRTGHTFIGWRDGDGTIHAAGSDIIISGNVTLTAEWQANDYNVTYNANWTTADLGTISGDVPTASNPFNYEDTVTVEDNPGNLARTGHTLLGWARTSTATVAEFPLGGTPNTFEMPAEHVTLYAVWQVSEFAVTFINNHSVTDNTNYVLPVDVNYGSSLGTSMPANPNRTGHQFLGWFANRAGTGDEFTSTTVVYGNVTVYASWQADAHTVTYVAAGTETGGTVPAVVNTYFHAEVTVTGQGTLVQDGYSFVGWRDGSNNVFKEGDTLTISGDVTLTAVWTAHYMVSYNGNGNTGGTAPLGNDYLAGEVVTVQGQGTLVRSGHTFMGWSATQGATAAEFQAGDEFIMPAAHRTLYAIWQINSHDVTVRHYTFGWNETASDAVLYQEEVFTIVYGEQFTAELISIAGHVFDAAVSDDIMITMGDAGVIISLFYRQDSHELSIIDEIKLAVNDRFPEPVDNSISWAEFVDLLEAETIISNSAIIALSSEVPTLISPDFAAVDFTTVSTTPFVVTVEAIWPAGQTDSQTVLVHIVDEVAPLITVDVDHVTFYTNNPPNDIATILAAAGVSVLDNYDGPVEPLVSFMGTTFEDINWARGNMEYAMFVDAVDSSGNVAQSELIVVAIVQIGDGNGGGNGGTPGGRPPSGGWVGNRPGTVAGVGVTPLEALPYTPFVEEHIAYISGFPDGTVRPGQSITRAEIAMILFRLLDSDSKHLAQASHFSDVQDGNWYTQAINYLASRNILAGYEDGTFRPNAQITRAELAAVMSRFFELNNNGINSFSDVRSNHWAFAYINNAHIRGWITGFEDGTFRPNNATTRAEAVTLINRVLNRRPNPATINEHLAGIQVFTDITSTHWAFYEIMEAAIEHEFELDAAGREVWTNIVLPR